MAVKYEITASTGETYKGNDGQERTRYVRCGVVIETKHGLSAKLDALPVKFDGWLNFWEPKPKERQPGEDEESPF